MKTIFAWDDYNTAHIAKHSISKEDAEFVVRGAAAPYPIAIGPEKILVRGRTVRGRMIQVIYVYRALDTIGIDDLGPIERLSIGDVDRCAYVIHARDY